MSRVGKRPIALPPGVEVTLEGSRLTTRGARGELEYCLPQGISVVREDRVIKVERLSDSKLHRSLHGLARTLIANMAQGVSQGFEKALEISGVGYRAQKKGEGIVLQLGFSHPVTFNPPPGISLEVDGTTRVRVLGADKALVGRIAAHIRSISPPDHYKGKGIRYAGEVVRLKPGKAGKVAKK